MYDINKLEQLVGNEYFIGNDMQLSYDMKSILETQPHKKAIAQPNQFAIAQPNMLAITQPNQ
ncbi:hypothetical protein [uncultured Legionella sp.]|uniref:hypothetical protein n=1 Tax=uncultured Legionella sp. TaxID=210934 RepID=UPI00262A4D4C|nr:hypothetical protein [uncultured Legionella sp.]